MCDNGDRDVKAFKIIDAPEAFQLLADETRRRMIYLLRAKELTVSQLAQELGLTPQAIYHHIRKLKDAGMVEVAREERVDHFIETYYRASAEIFHLAHGKGSGTAVMDQENREALESLAKLGLKVKLDADALAKIDNLCKAVKEPESTSPWAEKVNDLPEVSFLTKQTLLEYVNLMAMSDKEFEAFLHEWRDLRKALRSLLPEPTLLQKKP